MPTAAPDIQTRVAAAAWRVCPHTYAMRCSGGRWLPYPHLKYLSQIILRAVQQGNGRIIVNMPPRHGKSELVSFWTPTWLLDAFPEKRVIVASYGADLAVDFGRRVRNECMTNSLVGVELREDSQAAGYWNTPQGGGMLCAGIGGPVTGKGADLILLDDPTKNWADAHSRTVRQRTIDWLNTTLYTRAEPNASIIVVMARWADDDVTDYLVRDHGDDWQVVSMPALAEADDVMGRKPGEALCPERYTREDLLKTRNAIGDEGWAALYQQHPSETRKGKAYWNYSLANLDDSLELRDDLPLHLSVDFNSRPHMHCELGQHFESEDLLTAVHEIAPPNCHTARGAGLAFCDLIDRLGGWRWPELHLFGDATGAHAGRNVATGESEWMALTTAVRHRLPGITIRRRVGRANPPTEDSVTTFNEALRGVDGAVHYKHHSRCKLLGEDFRKVRRTEDGSLDKTDVLLTHATDAERYRVWRLRPVGHTVDEGVGGRFIV